MWRLMTRLAAGISFVLLIATVGLVNTVLKHVEHAFAGQRILVEKSMSLAKDHLVSNFTASAHQGEDLTASLAEDLDFVLPVVQGVRSVKRTEGKVERGSYRRFSAARSRRDRPRCSCRSGRICRGKKLFDIAHRLADALFVLDQRDADIALTVLAKANTRRYCHLGLLRQQL